MLIHKTNSECVNVPCEKLAYLTPDDGIPFVVEDTILEKKKRVRKRQSLCYTLLEKVCCQTGKGGTRELPAPFPFVSVVL